MENQNLLMKNDSLITTTKPEILCENWENKLSIVQSNGSIIAYDFLGSKISLESFLKGVERLSANFGIDFGAPEHKPKVLLLFEELVIAGWTTERFLATVRWVIHNQKFATWTLADWFTAPLAKLYTEGEILSRKKNGEKFTAYKIENTILWSEITNELPFERFITDTQDQTRNEPTNAEPIPHDVKKELDKFLGRSRITTERFATDEEIDRARENAKKTLEEMERTGNA